MIGIVSDEPIYENMRAFMVRQMECKIGDCIAFKI
jgi:hypothetical protein